MGWRLAPYLAVLALAVAGWWHGYSTGRDAERLAQIERIADLESDLAQVSAANRAAAAQIEAMRAAQAAIAREIEDEARNDPDAVHRIPSGDSLLRLKRRWSTP
jgi:hypothetical protein